MTKLVLFDFDGTLIDSRHFLLTAVNHGAAAVGIPTLNGYEELTGVGLPPLEALQHIYPDQPVETLQKVVGEYRQYIDDHKADLTESHPLYKGVAALLDVLQKNAYTLGIVTSMHKEGLMKVLAAHGLTDRFITLQTPQDGPAKPDPAPVLNAMMAAGFTAEDTFMIGDTSFDILAGKSAGVTAIGVTWGYHTCTHLEEAGADRVVDTFAELREALAP